MKDGLVYLSGKRYMKIEDRLEKLEELTDPEQIDAGDIVTVSITRNGEMFKPNYMFQLVGGTPDPNAEMPRVSIISPLGKTVFAQKVGNVGSYTVHENTFGVQILDKQKEEETKEEKGSRISLSLR